MLAFWRAVKTADDQPAPSPNPAAIKAIDLELLTDLVKMMRPLPVAASVLAVAVTYLLPSPWPPTVKWTWCALLLCVGGVHAIFNYYFARAAKAPNIDPYSWIRRLTLMEWVGATLWALMLPVFAIPTEPTHNQMIFFLLALNVFLSANLNYRVTPVYVAGTIPPLTAGIVGAFVEQSQWITLLEISVVFCYAYLTVSSLSMKERLKAEVRLRLHNTGLVKGMARAKKLSEAARRRAEAIADRMRAQEAYSRALVENAFDAILIVDIDGEIAYASPAVKQFDQAHEDLTGLNIFDLLPTRRAEQIKQGNQHRSKPSSNSRIFIEQFFSTTRAPFWLEIVATDLRTDPAVNGFVLNLRDITKRKRADEELRGHFKILESLADGSPLHDVLVEVARAAERSNPGARAAILTATDEGKLAIEAAPGLSQQFRDIVDNSPIDKMPSGQAICTGERVIISNTKTHPLTSGNAHLAEDLNVKACWSQPIFSRSGQPLGAIAMYFEQECEPNQWEADFLTGIAQLAGITIERRREEAELRAATETALMASRAKSKFLANMSHELRTPLNAIIGFSEIMIKGMFGPLNNDHYQEYATDIWDSGRHLLSVIDDILDISKIEAGRYTLEESAVNVAQIIDWSVEMVRPRAQERGQRLLTTMTGGLPDIHADQRAMRQILLNLLSNATKFSPDGGTITVACNVNDEGELEITVGDTGIGIPTDKLDEVLTPFGQVGDVTSRQHQGTGLGLPITKSLVEMHQGRFRLHSELGAGTIITIILPRERLLPAPQLEKQSAD